MTNNKQPISSKLAPQAVGSYSQAIKSGDMLFLSGQIAIDHQTNQLVTGGVAAQANQIMRNISAVLMEAGCDFNNLLKVTIYLVDIGDFAKVDAVYSSYLTPPYPARATVGVASLPKGTLVEIEAIARVF
ncbi:MAG: RidA family protein [Magnetococcales bacterium]|nr:RidA family protein [Magnetococcales bacterium]